MFRVPRLTLTVLVVTALGTVPFVGAATGGASPVTVVVTLADPMLTVPASLRPAAIAEAHRSLLDDLGGRSPEDVRSLGSANVLIATVTPVQRMRLAADPRVAAVGVDAPLPAAAPDPSESETSPWTDEPVEPEATAEQPPTAEPEPTTEPESSTPAAPAAGPGTLPPVPVPAAACSGTEDEPQLEPEALTTLNARSDDPTARTAGSLGYDGTGVTVGVISTNLDPAAPNFIRPDGTSAVVDYQAFVAGGLQQTGGEAAEAFGDVSSIVAQGQVTYDLAGYVNPAAATLPDGHCFIRVVGVAPGASVVATNSDDSDALTTGGTVLAIDYAIAAGVDILSESFSYNLVPDVALRSAVQAANRAAIAAGITVVASSGDAGPNSTIGNSASDPGVIAVGASTDARFAAQTGGYGLTRFGNGTWLNDTTSVISSAGITQAGGTIDVVAPGDSGWASCSAAPRFPACTAVGTLSRPSDLLLFSGTSQSAPLVAGIAALVVQAYRDGHAGASPTPDQVQRLLTSTAADLGLPSDLQGSGQADAYAAVLAARGPGPLRGGGLPAVDVGALVADDAQLRLTGTGDLTLRTKVTNAGTAPLVLDPVTLTADDTDTAGDRATYPIAFDPTAPDFADGVLGEATAAVSQEFDVPAGVPWVRLQLNAVPGSRAPVASVAATAFDPDGTAAAFGVSAQGIQLWLPRPAAGRWTVVFQSSPVLTYTGDLVVDLGRRTVLATDDTTRVLAPGAATELALTVPAPAGPGDVAATLRVGSALAMPVVLRRPVDLTTGRATVDGVLGPVNGRADAPFQSATWEFDVPVGTRSLSAGVTANGPIRLAASSMLVGPDVVTRSIADNQRQGGPATTDMGQTVADPPPGRWRVTVLFWQIQYLAAATDVPFTVELSLDAVRPSATGLPDGAALTAGSVASATMTVTNPGPTPLALLVDARTDQTAPVELPAVVNTLTVPLPVADMATMPVFVLPPFTSSLTVSAESDVATLMEVTGPTGDPDVLSTPGTRPSVTLDDGLTPGPWTALFSVPGAVGNQPSPTGTATVRAVARTRAYDPSVTDGSGAAFVDATGVSATQAPVVVAPGATVTVTALVPVSGDPGTVRAGQLALVTAPQASGTAVGTASGRISGDVMAVFPYSYVVAAAPTAPSTAEPTPEPTPTSDVVIPTPEPTTASPSTPATTAAATTTASATGTTTPPAGRQADAPLAHTGTDTRTPAVWGLALLLAGAAFVVAARRRTHRRTHRPPPAPPNEV